MRAGTERATARGRTLLRVEGVTKAFGGVLALDDLSFTVAPGRPLGFVGSNGAILQAANQRVRVAAALRDAGLDDARPPARSPRRRSR